VCDLETSRMGAPYIYIYDISSLRVKYEYSDLPQVHDRNCIPGRDIFLFLVKSEQSPRLAKPSVPRMLLGVSAANY